MPLTDKDPNVGGRASRASSFSVMTKEDVLAKTNAQQAATLGAGVLGMLRTTTETGDLGAFSSIQRRLPRIPNGHPPPRKTNGLTPSRTSSHYSRNGSIRSRASDRSNGDHNIPGAWPHGHHPTVDMQVSGPREDTRSSSNGYEQTRSLALATFERAHAYERAPSLTSSIHPSRSLKDHRSMTSLRSHGSSHRPRSPYVYPSRLKRPHHRPPSPALSDNTGMAYNRTLLRRPGPNSRALTSSPFAPTLYDHGYLHAPDHVRVRAGGGDMYSHHQGLVDPRYRDPPIFNQPAPQHMMPSQQQYNNAPSHHHHAVPNYGDIGRHYAAPPQGFAIPHQQFVAVSQLMTEPSQVMDPPQPNFEDEMRTQYPVYPGRRTLQPPIVADQAYHDPADTTPYVGFVHRVKTVLEERISQEDMQRQHPPPRSPPPKAIIFSTPPVSELPASPVVKPLFRRDRSAAETATNGTTAFQNNGVLTVKAAHASKVLADVTCSMVLADSSECSTRLTRDMIKAATGPGSDVGSPHLKVKTSIDFGDVTSRSHQFVSPPSTQGTIESKSSQTYTTEYASNDSSGSSGPPSDYVTQDLAALTVEDLSQSAKTSRRSTHTFSLKEPEVIRALDPGYTTIVDVTHRTMSVRPSSYPLHLEQKHNIRYAQDDRRVMVQSMPPSPNVQRIAPIEYVEDAKEPVTNTILSPAQTAIPAATPQTHPPPMVPSIYQAEPDVVQPQVVIHEEIWHPPSSTQTQSWASSSILARGSFDPTAQPSNRSTMSAFDEQSTETRRSRASTLNPLLPFRKSMQRSLVPRETVDATLTAQRDGPVNEPRYSSVRPFQFPLPDLTEDSQEDMSATNLRMLGARAPAFRSVATRAVRGEGRQLLRPGIMEHPSSYLSRTPDDKNAMPSLKFSQMDLTTKLNQALNLRSSRSVEGLRRSTVELMNDPRTNTTQILKDQLLKERYKSFFFPTKDDEHEMTASEEAPRRKLQQDDLIDEINRLAIPSVTNLTDRLSEMIPSIRKRRSELDLTRDEEGMRLIIDEIRGMGRPSRRNSLTTMALSPVHTNKDDKKEPIMDRMIQKVARYPHTDKDLPPLPSDFADGKRFRNFDAMSDLPTISRLASRNDGVYELRSSSSVKRSPKYPLGKLSLEQRNTFARTASHTSRSAGKMSDTRLRASQSASTLRASRVAQLPRSSSLDYDSGSARKATSTALLVSEASIRAGLLETLQKRVGKRSAVDRRGIPMNVTIRRLEDRPVDPGDRYPTTGLAPLTGLHLEETRSFFSDDSSRCEQPFSLRKRITRLRPCKAVSPLMVLENDNREPTSTLNTTTHWLEASGSVFGDSHVELNRPPEVVMFYEQPAVGMSKVEFRAKRVVEKLRSYWYRGGHFLRHLGGGGPGSKPMGGKKLHIARNDRDGPYTGV